MFFVPNSIMSGKSELQVVPIYLTKILFDRNFYEQVENVFLNWIGQLVFILPFEMKNSNFYYLVMVFGDIDSIYFASMVVSFYLRFENTMSENYSRMKMRKIRILQSKLTILVHL